MTGTVEYRDGGFWRSIRVALFRSVPMAVRRLRADGTLSDDPSNASYPVAQILFDPDCRFTPGEKIMASDLGKVLFISEDPDAQQLAIEAGWELVSESTTQNVA